MDVCVGLVECNLLGPPAENIWSRARTELAQYKSIKQKGNSWFLHIKLLLFIYPSFQQH